MKVRIEFDQDDFVQMLIDFFAAAGYEIPSPEQTRLRKVFNDAFESEFQIEVLPGEVSVPITEEISLLPVVIKEVIPPEEEQVPVVTQGLTFSQIMDPSHSDDLPEIKKILNLSRKLEAPTK